MFKLNMEILCNKNKVFISTAVVIPFTNKWTSLQNKGDFRMLFYAIIFMLSALTFYTVGVWSEKKQGTLKKWHLYVFWMGLVFDTIGTTIMSIISVGSFKFDFHGITGLLAIVLMLFHAIWATVVLMKNAEYMKAKFHRFSIIVWLIWLIPFVSGAMFAMAK
jgi:uncharacterized repeat protein (TIGR03987 family)